MDYKKIAHNILQEIGNSENIVSAAHCSTRLRLVIKSDEKVNKKALENIEGIKGVFFASGQLQIICGTGAVNKIYTEFSKLTGQIEVSKEDLKKVAGANDNKFKKVIKTLGDVFVPIIPAIVASGLMMGLTEAINFCVNNGFFELNTKASWYVFLAMFSNIAYIFLPILIGFSSAKVFGGNQFLGAIIAMIMLHPNLQNAWTVASEGVLNTQPVWGGLYDIPMVGYQGHIIPIVIAVYIMSFIENKLHKIQRLYLHLLCLYNLSVYSYLL